MDIPINFINEPTKKFYECESRHSLICGGFGSGKTFVACNKALTLLTQFDGYRFLFGRLKYKTLRETTMKTFYKICPPELYDPRYGGRRSDIDGQLRLINNSEVKFVHLDDFDEDLLRGIELNSACLDQAEELPEGIVDVLDTRLGRWDMAKPGKALAKQFPNWPQNAAGRYLVPAYLLQTCNPEDETHWIWRKYHPDSLEHKNSYADYAYFEVSTLDNPYLSPETVKVMLSRDPSWVDRFVKGLWGISDATVHHLTSESVINPDPDWIRNLLKKAVLIRSFDHGDSSPSCCLWWATWEGQYFCFREYYEAGQSISTHRRNITDLSYDETYNYNVADPSIFQVEQRSRGGYWSVADEYIDSILDSPPLRFIPGDNNELATRNRINEYLKLDVNLKHPITGKSPAPRIYFIERSRDYPQGCDRAIVELRSQKRIKLGTLNGKDIFSEERQRGIADHAYDPIRYFVASHAGFKGEIVRQPSASSFLAARNRLKSLRISGQYNKYGDFKPRAHIK